MSRSRAWQIGMALAIVAAWIAVLAATKPDPKETPSVASVVKVDPPTTTDNASTQERPKSPECMAALNELSSVKTDLVFHRATKSTLRFRSQRHPEIEDISLDCSLEALSIGLSFAPDSNFRDDDAGKRAPMWFYELTAKYGSVVTSVPASRLKDASIACVRAARSPKNEGQYEISGKNFVVTCSLGTGYGGATYIEVVQKK